MSFSNFEIICDQLTSGKITERKKASEQFFTALRVDKTIEYINRDGEKLWAYVLSQVHKFLLKDADKAIDDKRKKGTSSVPNSGGIFYETVKTIVQEGRGYKVQDILKHISDCLDDTDLTKYFCVHYLKALRVIMLPNEYIRSNIIPSDWNVMLKRLRNRLKNDSLLNGGDAKDFLETTSQLIKYGPLHGFPSDNLREQFVFISQLCGEITPNHTRPLQCAVVDIAYNFCLHTAKDNRVSCCKLGEETFSSMISLYEVQNPRNDGMKILLIRYLLMQVVMHHPKGVPEGHAGAYAFSWEKWGHCLRSIYKKCHEDISNTMKMYPHFSNPILFLEEKEIKYLHKDFVQLFAEVIKQIDLRSSMAEMESHHGSSKRKKIGSLVKDITDLILQKQQWPWLNIMCEIIRSHPDMLSEELFIQLLQMLSKLQVDCKDKTFIHHIYCCLSLLKDNEESLQLCSNQEVHKTWAVIYDTTLRSFGLNLKDSALHNLLQKLILNSSTINPDIIHRTYTSEVLDATEDNLKILDITFSCFGCTQNEFQKRLLIKWIINKNNTDNYKYMSRSITGKVLVMLIVEKWPISTNILKSPWNVQNRLFDDIGNNHMITAFEESLMTPAPHVERRNEEVMCRKIVLHKELCKFLLDGLQELHENLRVGRDKMKKLVNLFYFMALIKNVTSYLLRFNLIEKEEIDENPLLHLMPTIYGTVDDLLNEFYNDKNFDDRSIGVINEVITCFYEMLLNSIDETFDMKFRETIPLSFLKTVISFLHDTPREAKTAFKEFCTPIKNLRINILQTLVRYSCDIGDSSQLGESVFEGLATFDYSINEYENCDLPLAFLRSIRECGVQSLRIGSIGYVLTLLSQLCEFRYRFYSSAIEILQFIRDTCQHVLSHGSEENKELLLNILYQFFLLRNNYGPGCIVVLVECFGKLYKADPLCTFTKWNGVEIILKLPEFICSKHQEVRFAAIRNLVVFFEISSQTYQSNRHDSIKAYHLQEMMFADLCEKCEKIFEVEGTLTEERKVDETLTRSASVLHVLTCVMTASNLWREESLFILLKIVHKRRIVSDSCRKALTMASKNLQLNSSVTFMKRYFEILLRRWNIEGLPLEDYPISLFGCDNRYSFYRDYLQDVLPIIIEYDTAVLKNIADYSGKTMSALLKESFPSLFVNIILSNKTDGTYEKIMTNELSRFLFEHINEEEFRLLLTHNLHDIILRLISSVKDEDSFQTKFEEKIIFAKLYMKTINVEEFELALDYIMEKVYPGQSLIENLLTKNFDKIQRIMMQLNVKIHSSLTSEDMILRFHHYTIMTDLVLQNLRVSNAQNYFVRDICYSLLRFMKNYETHPNLAKLALIQLQKNFEHLSQFPDILKKDFGSIVTTLIDNVIDKKDEETTAVSLNLLNVLIIDNSEYFKEILIHMDDIPDNPPLSQLHKIQFAMKYGEKERSLMDEIRNFVNFGNLHKGGSSKLGSIRRLKEHLWCHKRQLKVLYESLVDMRGFSEDCEKSLLHQLMSLLIEISQSENKEISMEALKCLGELGPSDLLTLVVKSEKYLTYTNFTPFEFFTGQVVSLLNLYMQDPDIRLLEPSTDILYHVLNTKEGRKILDSNEDYGYGVIPREYLKPFISKQKPTVSVLSVDCDQLLTNLSDNLWCPIGETKYDEWIRLLVCNILKSMTDSYISKLTSICELKVEFCEIILPSLVYLLVSLNKSNINNALTARINKFFEEHWLSYSPSISPKIDHIVTNKKAVQVMLGVVHFVRVNKNNMKLKKDMEDLDLNYLKIAKAAQYCDAYYTSLLYIELWCNLKSEELNSGNISYKSSVLDLIYETESEDIALAVINILRSSYKAIGDLDSLHGCGTYLLLNPQHRIEHYKDSGMWNDAILFHNMEISRGIGNSKDMLMESFKHCGLYETSLLCQGELDAPDYECMWRLSNWALPEVAENITHDNTITFEEKMEKQKYFALKSVHERDIPGVMEHIEKARMLVVSKFKHISLESTNNLYKILTYLQGLNEIEEYLNADPDDDLMLVLQKWNRQDDIYKNNFAYIEPIITQRIVILKDYFLKSQTEGTAFYRNHLIDFSLKLSEKARFENKTHIGMRSLSFLQNLVNLSENEKHRVFLEDAQLCWKRDNKLAGRRILHQACQGNDKDPRIRAQALNLYGKWSMETYSEHPNSVIKNYFMESLTALKDLKKDENDIKSIIATYDTIGRYADREYQQITAHIESDAFQKKMKHMLKAAETLRQLQRKTNQTTDEKKAKALHDGQTSIDHSEIENTKSERDSYLKLAITNYLRSLIHSDEYNLQIFRIFTLFLENKSSALAMPLMKEYIPKIPSYKFLIILPQIIPHIASGNTDDIFSQHCNLIIEKCAREHPYHTLPIILALANSHKDADYTNSKTKSTVNEERVSEAKKVIKNLKKSEDLRDIIKKYEILSDALVELAYLNPKTSDADRRKENRYNIPLRSKIMSIKNFDSIPILTDNLPVRKDGNYEGITGIHSYDKYYDLVGGLNAPKKISCRGSDGIDREELVKGQDDLRQDAVMQQVFTVMNRLLNLNKPTCGLKIRTYKIVPLSMRSGILEWATNTIPVGNYLVGDDKVKGAHQLYRPHDKTPSYCRNALRAAIKQSAEEKLEVFKRICDSFKPVFHKFFEENFLHPTAWYERRRAYIRSVATTSMCGYILGIGDRHVSNILIDKTTAEVVHIDFGIAFEQGKTLPTPETVPFRLTRDFVDAMGTAGVEGAFRSYCEKTMAVMRDNWQTIMALLGVLLYDPLYTWTVSAAEANKRQRSSLDESTNGPQFTEDSPINTTAERALLRLKDKLLGMEEGIPMSVEHQVGALIHQAMDPANLCRLFNGWQAYL